MTLRNFVSFVLIWVLSLRFVNAKPVAKKDPATPTSLSLPANVVWPSTLPLTAGSSSLPAPPSALVLRHVTIGHGVQNYTCANPDSVPVPLGAIATLYDITWLSLLSSTTASKIPPIAALQHLTTSLIPGCPLFIDGLGSFPVLGYHYFTATSTPTFELDTVGERLFASKVADIKAPPGASKGVTWHGKEGNGAVDWLALTALPGTSGGDLESVGLKMVYRVDTAGGSPPATCAGRAEGEVLSVPYSAGYHFYG